MQQEFLIRHHHPSLVLFFAGWGMDKEPFQPTPEMAASATSDVLICYDYRTPAFDVTPLEGYTAMTLIGWSMGVFMASYTLSDYPDLPLTKRMAINGTCWPIDAERGIPPTIFAGTLQTLNEATLQKFRRRMCGSSEAFRAFSTRAPHRSADELKEELLAIEQLYVSTASISHPSTRKLGESTSFSWDAALIGLHDLIFPPAHQAAAWQASTTQTISIAEAHYTDQLLLLLYRPIDSPLNLFDL
ncbi:MAG: DUF452 family protein [Bacteroidia bacterium]|nr:DUF452 family protein [Bacteroidia bacterium]